MDHPQAVRWPSARCVRSFAMHVQREGRTSARNQFTGRARRKTTASGFFFAVLGPPENLSSATCRTRTNSGRRSSWSPEHLAATGVSSSILTDRAPTADRRTKRRRVGRAGAEVAERRHRTAGDPRLGDPATIRSKAAGTATRPSSAAAQGTAGESERNQGGLMYQTKTWRTRTSVSSRRPRDGPVPIGELLASADSRPSRRSANRTSRWPAPFNASERDHRHEQRTRRDLLNLCRLDWPTCCSSGPRLFPDAVAIGPDGRPRHRLLNGRLEIAEELRELLPHRRRGGHVDEPR